MSSMDGESAEERPDLYSTDKSSSARTSDVYRVDKNLPNRFNHPECFRGYSKKTINPLYQTSNQTYGSRKPTVHEMPTTFHGSHRKFSEHILKSGMYRDNGFNTTPDKSRITGPSTIAMLHDRITFHQSYRAEGSQQTEANISLSSHVGLI